MTDEATTGGAAGPLESDLALDADLVVHRFGRPDAPTILLLHGLTEAGTAWPDLVAHLGNDWNVVAPDLRGHGLSPRYTAPELIDPPGVLLRDVLALLESVGPAVVYGHSLGGNAALRAAEARPDLVRALVLEDPTKPSGSAELDLSYVAGTEAFLDVMSQPAAEVAQEVERMRRETTWSDAELQGWAESKPRVDRAYLRRGTLVIGGEWEAAFDALAVPTLLVLPPDAEMAPRAELVTNPLVERVVVPDSGHCVRRDQPALVHRALAEFLERVASVA